MNFCPCPKCAAAAGNGEPGAGRVVGPARPEGSVGGNALSDYASRNFKEEITGRVIKIQRERAVVGVALIAKDKRFGQGNRSQEISTYIVRPYSVSELESPWRRLLPSPEADVSAPWVDVWVVNFGAASIPDLVRLLDGLIPNLKTDMPKSNDGRVDRIITRGGRAILDGRL